MGMIDVSVTGMCSVRVYFVMGREFFSKLHVLVHFNCTYIVNDTYNSTV